jgi:hypothetical protein
MLSRLSFYGKNKLTENKMKKKYPLILSLLIILAVSACGPAPTPTLSAEEIANTAVAQAWIAITQTQAAMPTATPTATPLPPTLTPLPTDTLLPTLAVVATSASVSNPGVATQDPCNQPPPIKPQGAIVQVQFVNKSGGNVNLSFGMNSPNDKSECVTYTFTLGVYDQPVVSVLAGCYWGYAWITGKLPSVARTGGTILCVSDPNKIPPIWITKEQIYFH